MKSRFAALLVALLAVPMLAGVCRAMEKMSDEELKTLLGRPDIVIIDLRTGGEWDGSPCKVPKAVHEDSTDVQSWAAKYSPGACIVLYCS